MLRATQGRLDIFQALALEAALLVVLAGKGLDHADRGENFFDHRNQLALFLSYVARGFFDAPGEE